MSLEKEKSFLAKLSKKLLTPDMGTDIIYSWGHTKRSNGCGTLVSTATVCTNLNKLLEDGVGRGNICYFKGSELPGMVLVRSGRPEFYKMRWEDSYYQPRYVAVHCLGSEDD